MNQAMGASKKAEGCSHQWQARLTELLTVWITCEHHNAHTYLGRYTLPEWFQKLGELVPDALTLSLEAFVEDDDSC